MIETYIRNEVDEYINNEINYLKSYMDVSSYNKSDLEYLNRLENISDEEKENIVYRILDDDQFSQFINETIHYYLYH